jgi:hypothetical protein
MSDLIAGLIRLGQAALFTGITLTFLVWLVSVAWPLLVVLVVTAILMSLNDYANRVEEAMARRNAPKHWWSR